MPEIDQRELAWAAGLFEGEGCVTLRWTTGNRGRTKYPQPVLALSMADDDAVLRFRTAVGLGTVAYAKPQKETYKPQYRWSVQTHEQVQAVLAMLWFGLGRRRRSRAIQVLKEARSGGRVN